MKQRQSRGLMPWILTLLCAVLLTVWVLGSMPAAPKEGAAVAAGTAYLDSAAAKDASAIADHLREKRTVVLNLESTNKEIARRLLDFLSGVAYANEGKIKKVAISTYIITPYNVDILGDLIDELENNGMYF